MWVSIRFDTLCVSHLYDIERPGGILRLDEHQIPHGVYNKVHYGCSLSFGDRQAIWTMS